MLCGRTIAGVEVKKPIVLRLAVEGTPAELLVGRRFVAVLGRFWRRSLLRPVWIVFVSHPGSPSALAGSAIRPRRRRGAAGAIQQT